MSDSDDYITTLFIKNLMKYLNFYDLLLQKVNIKKSFMSEKKISIKSNIETSIETGMFASRWLMAPIYVILCLSLALITFKVLVALIAIIIGIYFVKKTTSSKKILI